MRKAAALPLFILLLCCLPTAAAEDVSGENCVVASSGVPAVEALFDMDLETAQSCAEDASVRFYHADGIASVYLVFDREYGFLTLTEEETGRTAAVSTGGMLHFFLDLEECFGAAPRKVTLRFSTGEARLNELRLFTPGELPDWVQRWEKIPEGEADLLLLSTHGDDEQLFFAGLLPWYAGEKGYRVQVVYFTDHRNLTSHRVHEMLNGLWAAGVRDYPVFGPFADYYTFDMEDAYRYYESTGHPRQELLGFVTEQLRRYRPLVAVGHDVAGEYGHGMHKLTADLLMEAVQISSEPDAFPELDEKYGTWLVPKTYLHLYPDNPITMDWDIPLAAFDGMTAYEVSKQKGFPCHASQMEDFAWYFRGADRASDVEKYSPCQYGLYQTTVGEDTGQGDFFEHLEEYRTEPVPTESTRETEPAPEPQPALSSTAVPETLPERGETADSAEKNWILLPLVGTIVLTVLTVCLSVPAFGKNT